MEVIAKIYELLKDKKLIANGAKVIDIKINENAIRFIIKRDYFDEEKDKIEYFEIKLEEE